MSEFEPIPEDCMQNQIEQHNNSLAKLKYRLGDSIRHNNVSLNNLKNTIAYKYHKHPDKKNKACESHHINYELLHNIVISSDYKECPENSIVFNLRLHEWFNWANSKVVSNDSNYEFIDKNSKLLSTLNNIFLLYGSTIKTNVEKTEKYVKDLITYLKKYNSNIYILNSPNADQDFKYCVTAQYYVPSVGGFSTLSAAINKNNVFWELSDKYFRHYRSSNEKKHIKQFKEYQIESANK